MPKDQETYGEEETTRRVQEALRRAFATPHKPHKPIKDSGKSPAKRGRPKKRNAEHEPKNG